MSELYWITRLGVISTASNIIFGLSLGVLLVAFLGYLVYKFDYYYTEEELEKYDAKFRTVVIKIIPIITISALVSLLVPSKNELIMIYGIGGTIDYIQDNDKAKELPDKVIDALDIYLDNINKEKEN